MQTLQPKQAESPQTSPVLSAGVDCGAGLVKLVIGGNVSKIRTLSKLVEVGEELHDVLTDAEGGHFYYHRGTRSDLQGREFLTGSLAQWKAPASHVKLSDDPALKVEYALHMILGALASLPHRSEWNLHLVVSVHNAKLFGRRLAENVNGIHIISTGGKKNPQSRISLTVSLVAPEGAGAYAVCVASTLIDPTGQAIAVDFGTSTVIPAVFALGGKLIHHQPLEVGGVIDLLEAIASDTELVAHIGTGKPGNVEAVRRSIENKSFQYGGIRPFNFHTIYSKHLKTWLADRLRLAFKEVAEWRDEAQSLVAWGGGSELPGVTGMLAAQGIKATSEGCWANAVGLQRIAEGRLQRGK